MNQHINIIISGAYGKMGCSLIKELKKNNQIICVAALINPITYHIQKNQKKIKKKFSFPILTLEKLKKNTNINFDVMIDFSTPENSLENIKFCLQRNKKIVIGTTGFTDTQMKKIKKYSKKISILCSPNFSLGINLMCLILEKIFKILGEVNEISILETHHSQKKDLPSGTSLYLQSIITNFFNWKFLKKDILNYYYLNTKNVQKKIGSSSIRIGKVIGEHTVILSMKEEIIKITHQANHRNIFSRGALNSVVWINNKKNGFFTMEDTLKEVI